MRIFWQPILDAGQMRGLDVRVATRVVLGIAYSVATAGLLVLALGTYLFDEWPVVAVSGAGLLALAVALVLRHSLAWLVVAGVWIYAAIMVAIRAHSDDGRVGFALVFAALAVGALAAFVARQWEVV